jgi:hypothetical protein
MRFEPSGPTGELGIVSSPIDAAFKWLTKFAEEEKAE